MKDRLIAITVAIACLAAAAPPAPAPPQAPPPAPAPAEAPRQPSGAALAATAPATQVTSAAAVADEFATFGVDVRPPLGWQRTWEGRANMIARWSNATADAPAPGRAPRATAVMTLELEPANGRTLAQYVAARQEQMRDAQVGIHALVMGGQPAMRITGRDASGNAAVDVLLTLNERAFYILSGYAAVPRLLPSGAMDEIAQTMKFVEPADPAAAVAPREPVTFLDRFRIAPLSTMRPSPEPAPARSVHLVVTDYRIVPPTTALSAEMQIIHNPNRLPLLDLGDQIARQVSPGTAVEWSEMPPAAEPAAAAPPPSPRAISRPFTFARSDGRNVSRRLGLVRLSETEVLYINFVIGSEQPASRAAMEAACEARVASVVPVARSR